jgi:sugar lactone lactonase YvrE
VVRFEHDGSTTVIAASFHKLGRIVHGRSETTNIAFGGDDWKTLYFTNWNYLGAVKLKIAGISVPVSKKT